MVRGVAAMVAIGSRFPGRETRSLDAAGRYEHALPRLTDVEERLQAGLIGWTRRRMPRLHWRARLRLWLHLP